MKWLGIMSIEYGTRIDFHIFYSKERAFISRKKYLDLGVAEKLAGGGIPGMELKESLRGAYRVTVILLSLWFRSWVRLPRLSRSERRVVRLQFNGVGCGIVHSYVLFPHLGCLASFMERTS